MDRVHHASEGSYQHAAHMKVYSGCTVQSVSSIDLGLGGRTSV